MRTVLLARPERLKQFTLIALIVIAGVLFNVVIDNYVSGRFFNRMTQSIAITAVLAAGQSLVIITRNVDLSVGATAGVGAYATGRLLGEFGGVPPVGAALIAAAIGAALGLFNGVLVAYGRVPSIIVTLGTLAIYRTALINLAGARTITVDSLPQWLVDLPRSTVFSIGDFEFRSMFVAAVVVVTVLQLALWRLRAGRLLYATGSNPDAARQAGLPVRRTTVLAFVACGALAGFGGFLVLGRFGTITVTAGQGLELEAIAAAVVGGVSILGGSGTVLGSLLGATLIGLLNLSLVRVPQISEFVRDAVLGALILLAVVLDGALQRRLATRGRIMAGDEIVSTHREPPLAVPAGGAR